MAKPCFYIDGKYLTNEEMLDWASKQDISKIGKILPEFSHPNTPFKQTGQWVNLAIRKVMRYAAENGFDRIAWTNGTMQAERYDLSKQVDALVYKRVDGTFGGKIMFTVIGIKDKKVIFNEPVSEDKLAESFGKDIAQKITNGEGINNGGGETKLEGENLAVGGHGMRSFYDAIIPSAASKLGKPFGAKVESIDLSYEEELDYANPQSDLTVSKPVQSIPVTESMRKSAMEGLPLFRQQDTEPDTPLTPFIKRADELKQRSARAKELGKRFGVPVKVITNRNQLPERILRRMAAGKLYPGVFDGRTGQIYVLVDEVTDMSDVEKTIAHEVVAHKGLREMLGKDEFDSMLSDVFADMDAIDINFIRDQYKTKTYDPSNAEIAEEYIASLAETGNFPSWFGRVIAKVRSLLRSAGFNVEFTDADIMYLLWESQRRLLKNAGAAGYVQYKNKEGDVMENVRFSETISEPKRIYKNGKAKTYKTKEGETIPFDQANDYDNGAKGADLQRKDNRQQNPSLRKLREGEIATVENKYTADKNFIFDGRNKIESTDDVAFLFRKLETKAVENMFAALVDENGKAVIVHISMGGRAGTVMDFGILADAINRFTPKKVYLIHNHPSGNLTYSDADIRVHGKAKMAFGEDLIGEHIIINTTSGEYASFNHKYDYSIQERPKVVNELQKYKVIKLDKQLFLTDTKLPVISGASDVASFLTAQRFSQGGKLSAIILARNNEIKAYLHLPSTNFSKLAEVEKLVTELQAYAGRFGGSGIILASNKEITKNYRLLGDSLRSSDLTLLDIISVAGNNNYDSMANMGLIVSEPDIRFKISPTNTPTLDPVMVEGKREKFRENVQDKMLAPKNMQDEVAKRGGAVPQSADGYNAENRSQSRSMAMITNFNNNELDQLNTTLAEIVFKHDQDLKAISNYMLAKSSLERNNEEGTKALNDDVNGEWGQVEVEQIIADFEAAVPPAVVDQLWKDIKATTDFAIKTLYMGNVIGKDAYNAMKARKYYVPLKSWDFTDTENPVDFYSYAQGERTAYQGLHKAKGRGSKAADPLAYIESAAHSAVVSANKNMVKHKFLMLARLNPNMKDLFNIKKIYLMEKGVDAEGNPVYVNVIKDGEDAFSINGFQNNGQPILVNEGTFEDLYEAGTIVSKVSRRHMTRRPSYLASQHEVEVMENGERYIIAYGDPNVANSINGMNVAMPETTRWMQQTMYGKFMRWVTAGFTAKNPAFIPINWIRDLGYSSMSHALRKDGDLKGFVKNYKPGVAAIHRHLAGTAKPDQKADKDSKAYRDYLYEQFRLFGGETGFVHLKEIKDLQKDIDREVNRKGGKREGWDKISQNRAYSALGSLLDYSAILSENSARFATFLASYEGGKSFEQSASDAKNISVNFNRKGRITGLAGTFYGFFNASVQGADNFLEMSIKNKKNMAIAATSFFVAGVMLSEILKAAGPDDEEGKNAYDQLPEWVRKSNLCIPNFNGGFFTIPLPFVFREIYGAGVTLSDIAHGTKEPGEGIFDTFTSMFSAFSPIAVNSDELRAGKPPLRTLIPTLLTPIYDNIVNQDFTGRQVYRVPFTKEMERYTPHSELGAYNVNSLLENIAKGLNKLGGGNEYTPAGMQPKDGNVEPSLVTRFLADWNPSKAEHLLEYYLGGRGRFVNDIYKTVNAAVSSEKEVRTYNIPVLKRLYITPYKGDYWNEYREIQQEVKDFNRYLKLAEDNRDFQTMQEMLSNRRMRIISDMYKDRDKQVKELSDLIEVLQDPDQKKSARDMRELTIKTFVEQTHIIEDITKPADEK